MGRRHDVGGLEDFALPNDLGDEEPFHADWEAHVFAMMRALIRQRVLVLDEVRSAIEDMPVAAYEASSYYERWLDAMESLLVTKGVVSAHDLTSPHP